MDLKIEKLVLETINNCGSIMPLFKTGYGYAQVLIWCDELEKMGFISSNDDGIRILEQKGIKRLAELKKSPEKTAFNIKPLAQYKISKIGVDEIYLP